MKLNKLFPFIILLLLISLRISAQNQNIEFEDSKFPDRLKELKSAQKAIKKADEIADPTNSHFKSKGLGRYEEALKYYLEAYDFNPSNALLNYKIGVSYMKTVEKYKAVPYLDKAYILNKNVKNDLAYVLAQAYQFNYEFDKAIQKYLEYQKTLSAFDKDAIGLKVERQITECRNAKDFMKNPVNVKITNLGAVVNSRYPEYSPIVNADQSIMFFTARKPNTTGHGMAWDGKYYEDIYLTHNDNGIWSEPKNPGRPLNTKIHDAIGGLSLDGKTLLTYKVTNSDHGDIYISKLKGDKYTKPKRLNSNINTPYHESSATFSPDGKTLYFVSDREGGFGGRDIWMSQMDSRGEWGKAVNLGQTVNTSYNEEGVFMQGDGKTLYFSSQGHNSMGGYDIFKTTLVDGKWTEPVNLGYPINTPDDDVFFSITQDGRHGYYSSGKKGGYGDQDIYEIEFRDVKIQTIAVKGRIYDGDTKKPLAGTVEIKDKVLDIPVSTINTPVETGQYSANLPYNRSYVLHATSPGYSPYLENIPPGKEYNKGIPLYPAANNITKGNVYDFQTKEPVCNALVTVKSYETKTTVDTIRTICPTGEYHSTAPKGSIYDLAVYAPGYNPYLERIPQDKDVNEVIYIHKTSPLELNGFVYDAETKKPVCSADIDIKNIATMLSEDKLKSQCNDGSYHSDLPKGKSYQLNITAPDYVAFTDLIPPEKSVNKTVYLHKALPINTGSVYDAETQEEVCADIEILNANTNVVMEKLKTDCPSGQYHSKLPKGRPYIIKATAPGYLLYTENIPPDRDVNEIIFIHKPVQLITNGNVYDADTKEPVCADVDLVNTDSKKSVEKVKTDCPSGQYHLRSPKGISYLIKVTAPDYIAYSEDITPDRDVNRIIYIKKMAPLVIGNIYDEDTKEPVCAEIKIVNAKTKAVADKLKSDCPSGKYLSMAPIDKAYELSVNAPDYVPYVVNIKAGENVNKIIYIKKIQTAIVQGKLYDVTKFKSFVLPQILYDFDKYNLKPQYKDSLNNLINTMRAFPNIVIELGSHTDTRGTDVYNEKLSYNRAKSVVDYLISKGIAPERLVAKGYGKKVPRVLDVNASITSCNTKYKFDKGTVITDEFINALTGGKCEFEAAHQLNRRTEFKVLREDYVPGTKKSNKQVNIEVIKK